MITKIINQPTKLYFYSSDFLNKFIGLGPINWHILSLTRFILAFIVVSSHIVPHISNSGPLKLISRFNAFNAILGFLLISGLSIGKSILKNRDGYFLRRAQRIYPVYIASILLQYFVLPEDISISFIVVIIINIIFLNQVLTPTSYVGPAWTLALEIWLYSLAPLFLKQTFKTLLTLTCISFVCFCLYTCGRSLLHWPYFSGTSFGINIIFLSFIWIVGFMLAIFTDKTKFISFIIGGIFIIVFSLNFIITLASNIKRHQLDHFFKEDIINFIFEFICLLFIYIVVIGNRNMPKFSILNQKIFNFLGNISYPLYLSHFSVLILCKKFNINNWFLLVLCCLFVASIIYWIFDFYSKKRAT